MSSISVSGVGLQSFFQNVQNGGAQPVEATDNSVASGTSSSDDDSTPKVHHGHHHHGGGQFFSKLQGAVTSALQSAQSDPSADPNKVIEDAIAKVISGNSSDSSSTSNSSNTASSPTDGSAPASTPAAPGGPQQFFDTLKSLGVDPQQFHQDFLNAIHDAKNGNADPGSAFASFPPGSNIDTTA